MEGNRRNVRTILTHTGKIYVDIDNQLEFLTVGDYGKENNIKADFLGLTKEIHGVENTAVDLSKKWVATISTQKGCPMHCKFCDVPKFGFYGNASIEDMERQIRTIIEGESIKETDRFNVHFARMGEPTWNENVLAFGLALKGSLLDQQLKLSIRQSLPCFQKQIANLETSYRFGVVSRTNSTMEKRVYSFQLILQTMDREVNCLALEVCH